MSVNYKKLWKLLIDRDMKKKDLIAATGLSTVTVAKLAKNQNVTTDVLVRICTALGCNVGDIMDILPESCGEGTALPALYAAETARQ